jgi:hypothetical protein
MLYFDAFTYSTACMFKTLTFCSAIFLVISCSNKLHSGKSLSNDGVANWYAYVKDHKYEKASDVYQFTDSMIRLHGDKAGYLMSNKSYGDFELTLEFRWNMEPAYQRGSGKKNSGVMYNVPDTAHDMLWPAGIQFQVKEGATGDLILLENVTLTVRDTTRAPGKSVAVSRLSEQEKPLGQWNTILIRNIQGKCSQYLNGILVNEGTNASSKTGRILLQYEGSPIDFRNIAVKTLK